MLRVLLEWVTTEGGRVAVVRHVLKLGPKSAAPTPDAAATAVRGYLDANVKYVKGAGGRVLHCCGVVCSAAHARVQTLEP
jgi:hypothetical protein